MVRTQPVPLLLALLSLLVVGIPSLVFAQQDMGRMTGGSKDTSKQHMMMSREMMQHMQKDSQATEAALQDIRTAKSSNDPKVLRSALDKAEQTLSQVHEHITSHLKMMEEMHKGGAMQGGGDMMMHHPGMKDTMHNMPMDSTMMQ